MGLQQRNEEDPKGSSRLGSYLRKLRNGYGYSLRGVEQRARASGGEIDNSQLSRYEKGICYPSFDKLRTLASVFNVSIQSFSDIVDLEAFEELKPADGSPTELIEMGNQAMWAGDTAQGFACYERAIEILDDGPGSKEDRLLVAEARIHQAAALRRLGKLSLAEQELRRALRNSEALDPAVRTRALLALSNIHADEGDKILAEIESERAHTMAVEAGLDEMAVMALHTLAHVLAQQNRYLEAIERSREAAELYRRMGSAFEEIRVRINIGTYYVSMGKPKEGVRLLRECLVEARAKDHRRLQAMALTNLGEAYHRIGDRLTARNCFIESNALASMHDEHYDDLLFFNAYFEWRMALEDDNQTRARIAFGRLKALRPSLERRFAEVEAFDEFVERGRSHA